MILDREYPELEIDTSGARALEQHEGLNQLEELIGLRDWLERLHRDSYQKNLALDELKDSSKKKFLEMASTIVGIVDEMRRLQADAERVVSIDEPSEVPQKCSWFRSWRRSQEPASDVAVAWIKAMQRSVGSSMSKLESIGLIHIELVGKDLRELTHEGQPLKAWVSAKNKPKGTELIVKEEYHGLWVFRLEKQWIPVQRGEVLLK